MFHYECSCWWEFCSVFVAFQFSVSLTHPICSRYLLFTEAHWFIHFRKRRRCCIRLVWGGSLFPHELLRWLNTKRINSVHQWKLFGIYEQKPFCQELAFGRGCGSDNLCYLSCLAVRGVSVASVGEGNKSRWFPGWDRFEGYRRLKEFQLGKYLVCQNKIAPVCCWRWLAA